MDEFCDIFLVAFERRERVDAAELSEIAGGVFEEVDFRRAGGALRFFLDDCNGGVIARMGLAELKHVALPGGSPGRLDGESE